MNAAQPRITLPILGQGATPQPFVEPDPRTLIPDLLRVMPQVRPVLDRYGLHGCGGALGPHETLEFFARAHDVPLDRLLEEIRAAAASGARQELTAPEFEETLADRIYRPFFRAGIAVVLTLGAAWGVILLIRIAWSGSFAKVSLHEVNAHGHAQIFGWVGLFVMGFALQALPRFKHTALAHPRLAYATLWLMLGGLIVRSVLQPLVTWWTWAGPPAVMASVVEVLAIALFAWVVVVTLRGAERGLEFFDYYVLAGLAWFFLQAVYETVYFTATLSAPDRQHLLQLVATWQGPLREIQIHGFAMLMILGVSQRMFHYFYGFPEPDRRTGVTALPLINVAILGIVIGTVAMRTLGHAWALLWYASVLLMAGTVAVLVLRWRLFSRPAETDRSLKFLRAAYVWLFISLAMLVLLPAYQFGLLPWLAPDSAAAQMGFSHAYYGAIRHAVTVGFVSLMIVGVAAKVVPTLTGIDVHALSGLWVPFVLINLGCALRVSLQTLTDFTPAAFPASGVSGLLELTGLAVWGVHQWRLMTPRAAALEASAADIALDPSQPIAAEHRVGDVLVQYPGLLDEFVEFGFTLLRNPLLRTTLAQRVTIAQASRMMGVDLSRLLQTLNEHRADPAG
jgi:hypothetical protein